MTEIRFNVLIVEIEINKKLETHYNTLITSIILIISPLTHYI